MKNTEFLNFAVIHCPVKKLARHRSTPKFHKDRFEAMFVGRNGMGGQTDTNRRIEKYIGPWYLYEP